MVANKTHKKPAVPKAAKEAEKIAKTMYMALTAPDAPKATPDGYIMGATTVLKMLIDQAVQQGSEKEDLKMYALKQIMTI